MKLVDPENYGVIVIASEVDKGDFLDGLATSVLPALTGPHKITGGDPNCRYYSMPSGGVTSAATVT